MDLVSIGKLLVGPAVLLALFGVVLMLWGKGVLPRLPGDFSFTLGKVRVLFPLASSIVISVVLTLVLTLIARK